jgi:hypothetical protein
MSWRIVFSVSPTKSAVKQVCLTKNRRKNAHLDVLIGIVLNDLFYKTAKGIALGVKEKSFLTWLSVKREILI